MRTSKSNPPYKLLSGWLFLCAFLVFCMVAVGGVTRLTGSGLSMVEWKPISGAIPPLSESDWKAEFENYKKFPEYQLKNMTMTVPEFKSIFWLEFWHRNLGRLLGLVFFVPFVFFLKNNKIDPRLKRDLVVIATLGAIQGFMGWFMVKSGLSIEPRVSQYRLLIHLLLATVLLGSLIWTGFLAYYQLPRKPSQQRFNQKFVWLIISITVAMIASGALVAGTHAGLSWNTFPMMGDSFVPMIVYPDASLLNNIFEDLTTIQFNHRMMAYVTFILYVVFISLVLSLSRNSKTKLLSGFLILLIATQILLGIQTLLQHVPTVLASLHQTNALLLFSICVMVCFRLTYEQETNGP